jgi:hypothetical protein
MSITSIGFIIAQWLLVRRNQSGNIVVALAILRGLRIRPTVADEVNPV